MAEPAPAAPTPAPEPAPSPAPTPDPAPAPAPEPKADEPPKPEPSLMNKEPEKKEGDKKDSAPSAFEIDKITLPEGFTKDEKLFPKFAEIMTNDKLSPQERGQNLMNLYADAIKQVGDANTKAWSDLQTQWQGEIKADKEFGGDKLEPTLQSINKMLETHLGAEGAKTFKHALDVTGAGNNPAFYNGMAKLTKLLSEPSHITGSPGKGAQNLASVFFPNSPEMKGNS